jgi:phage regulator Rha-like protein
MENKQTAVDYYSNKIGRITSDLVIGKITGKQFVMLEIKLLDTAKEMEKQQIEDAFANGVDDEYEYHINNEPRTNSKEYYNKTFKN